MAARLVCATLSVAGLACALWIADLRWKALAPGALWCTLSAAVIFLLLALLQIQTRSERTAHVVTNLVLLPMIPPGGGVFPLEPMPAGLASISRLTPNGGALGRLKDILDGSPVATGLLLATAGMLLAGSAGVEPSRKPAWASALKQPTARSQGKAASQLTGQSGEMP